MRSVLNNKANEIKVFYNRRLIAHVNKDGRMALGTSPMLCIDKISLLEGVISLWPVSKMVENLSIIVCLVFSTGEVQSILMDY